MRMLWDHGIVAHVALVDFDTGILPTPYHAIKTDGSEEERGHLKGAVAYLTVAERNANPIVGVWL